MFSMVILEDFSLYFEFNRIKHVLNDIQFWLFNWNQWARAWTVVCWYFFANIIEATVTDSNLSTGSIHQNLVYRILRYKWKKKHQ